MGHEACSLLDRACFMSPIGTAGRADLSHAGTCRHGNAIRGLMRLLLFINLIAIVVLAGALGHIYEGTPLPWGASRSPTSGAAPEAGTTPVTEPVPPAAIANATPPEKMPTLRILTEGAYPPFNYRNGEGHLTGFDVDIANALCKRLKRECTIKARGWNGLLPALSRGEADAVIASILIPSPGREGPSVDSRIVFTRKYYSTPGHFAARKTNAMAAASAAAMAGKRVAAQQGSIHEAFLARRFPSAVIVAVPSLDDAEAALAEGRADFLFADRNALLRWLANGRGASCCRLVGAEYADPAYFGAGAGIALRSDNEALREDLNRALAAIAADGTYGEISRRYFGRNIR